MEDDSTPSQPEEKDLLAWQASQDKSLVPGLLGQYQPTIDAALRAYGPQKPSQILKDRAQLMALKALRGYRPGQGAKPTSYLYGQLQGIRQVAARVGNPLAIPEQLRRDRGHVLEAAQGLRDQLGRDPADREVAEHLGLPVRRVQRVLTGARKGVALSTLLESSEDDDQGDNLPVGYVRTPEDDWFEAVDHDLNPVDQQILRYRSGYQDYPQLPLQEVARRLNLTPQALSQRSQAIQARLDSFRA